MIKREAMKIVAKKHKPSYSNDYAAGLDIRIASEENIMIPPGGHAQIHTGLYVEIPRGHFGLIAIRSGLGSRGLTLSNSVGIIDEDYRGEIRIPVYNHGEESFDLEDGERIAQMILIPYIQANLEYVEEVEDLEESGRGQKGFGSSGRF